MSCTSQEIAQRLGIRIGHYEDSRRPTGCTVCLYPEGATGGVSVVGAAPGTRETDLLNPASTVEQVHGVLLSGGSAFGLDAATGVMHWLQEQNYGLNVGPVKVPIVPGAVLFDLWVDDFDRYPHGSGITPDAHAGYQACLNAMNPDLISGSGNVGAGAGATVGKLNGNECAMRGGLGMAMVEVDGFAMAAVVACNAIGDVINPATGQILAGARLSPDSHEFLNSVDAEMRGHHAADLKPGANTTIGVIMTDARLSKADAQNLARIGHDGLARTIRPVHTRMDGDTLFTLATGQNERSVDLMNLMTAATEVTAQAILAAICNAQPLCIGRFNYPAFKGTTQNA